MNTVRNDKWKTQIIRGTNYVYEDYPYWDKERKQNRHKREYIGKLGEDGGFMSTFATMGSVLKKKKRGSTNRSPWPKLRFGEVLN